VRLIRPPRIYEIAPEPGEAERAAIVEALEQVSFEDEAPTSWELLARREAVDDGLG
jgi:hypothetical protein